MKFLFLNLRRIAVCIYLIISTSANAQTLLGVKAIYANNNTKLDISNSSYTELRNGNSFGIGISANIQVNNTLNIQPSLEAINKAYSFNRFGNYQGVIEHHNDLYLQAPIRIKSKVFNKGNWKFNIDGGIYIGYWLGGRSKGLIPNLFNSINDSAVNSGQTIQYLQLTAYKQKHEFDPNLDNRFEIGWVPGICVEYCLKSSVFAASVDYYQSFTSQQKMDNPSSRAQYNRTFTASLGCFYDLKKIFRL